VILKKAHLAAVPGESGRKHPPYFVLAMVDPAIKSKPIGMILNNNFDFIY
jgi:hypothetical protein